MWQIKMLPFWIDLIFCLLLLPAMIMLLPIERWLVNNSSFVYLLVAWLYIVYALNRYVLMHSLSTGRKRWWLVISLIVFTIIGTCLITHYQMEAPLHQLRRMRYVQHFPGIRLQQQAVWFLYVVVMAFSMAVGLLTELYRQITKRQVVEFEKKKAELALYKAQINPHFLFNSLNTLYAMVVTKSSKAEEAFVQFIELMQYMYTNNIKDKVPLHTEIEYIHQYIELQKYRIPENFHIHFSYELDTQSSLEIAPMILITFVENVFKHGISSHKIGDAHITIRVENQELLFFTSNPLNNKTKNQTTGIGIENCKRRLELLYPNKYTLDIDKKDEMFVVSLRINLK